MAEITKLLTWMAVNNDPYERERRSGDFRYVDGQFVQEPTLNLLCDTDSAYKGVIGNGVVVVECVIKTDGSINTRRYDHGHT